MASQHVPLPKQQRQQQQQRSGGSTKETDTNRKQQPHTTHGTCEVWFHYLPGSDYVRQFLEDALPRNVAEITTITEETDGVEKSFGYLAECYRAKIKLQDGVSLQELEKLLFEKWSVFQGKCKHAAWMEVIPLERRMYKIVNNSESSSSCFNNVTISGGAFASSNCFICHWRISESPQLFGVIKWAATFEHNRELVEIKTSGEMFQIPYSQIEDRLVAQRHESSWDIYFGLKYVPKVSNVYNAKNQIREVSIHPINPEDLGNTSVIRLTIPDNNVTELPAAKDKPDFWPILARFKQRGFSLSYANVTDKLPQKEDLTRNVRFKTFDLEYGWQCLLSGGFKVTDTITPQSIQTLRGNRFNLPPDVFHRMASTAENTQFFDFENVLTESLQQVKHLVEDSDELSPHFTMSRRLVVTPTRVIPLLKEPIVKNRIIRQYNDDNFIRVIFRDEDFTRLGASGNVLNRISERIRKFLDEGFTIGDRKYEFLACSNSQLREHGVWFFCPYNDITSESIRNDIGDLTAERCVALYVSRMGLCFSASKATVAVEDESVEYVSDIKNESYCFTDGIGMISVSLAEKVAKKLKFEEVPSAFQIRYGGCKGVVAQNPTLGAGDKILIRNSMRKFKSLSKNLEILSTTRPGKLHLNRQVITLMSGRGVPDHVFLTLQEKMLFNMADMLLDDHKAMKALAEVHFGIKWKDLQRAGISFTNEVFFRSVLMTIYKSKLGELTRKARIELPCDQGRIMMGTVDETGTLEYGQVFISHTKNDGMTYSGIDVLDNEVVVAKNPCFHPGDLRKFQAVDVPELHHLVDCIVFPQIGPRPHPDEMSGSDLDGDMYFVCWDTALFPPGDNMDPMDFPKSTKSELSRPVAVSDITQFISQYINNDQLGVIANAHVVHADLKDIFCEECTNLCKMHSDAVDFPKTGVVPQMATNLRPDKYPDFMMKSDKPRYTSANILGKLYRQCRSLEQAHSRTYNADLLQQAPAKDPDIMYQGYEKFMKSARLHVNQYNEKIANLMSLYGIETEAEVVTGIIHNLKTKRGYFPNERYEIAQILKEKITVIRQNFREVFFDEFGGEEHSENTNPFTDGHSDILAKAAAYYVASYTMASEGKVMVSCPWIVSDLLVKIKSQRSIALSDGLSGLDDSNQTRESHVHAKIGSSIYQHFVSNENSFKMFMDAQAPERMLFIRRQLQKRPCYTLILTFLLNWARKYELIGEFRGAVFSEVVFVILALSILLDEDYATAAATQSSVPQNTQRQRYERSWISANEERHAACLLMKTFIGLKSILKPNTNGEVDISVLDPTYPTHRHLISGKRTAKEFRRMTDEILFAYQEIVKNRSVAVFFDQTICKNDSMMFILPLNVLNSVMYAETYVARRLSREYGAEVNILDMPFRDTPGLMLEAWGSPEQLWTVQLSLQDLEEKSAIDTMVRRSDIIDGAFKCVYSGSTSPDDRLIFTQYCGPRHSAHEQKTLYTASPYTPNSVKASDSTAFKQVFKERLEIIRQDFINTYHGDLWIALTFGIFYLFNIDRHDYTISELETKRTEHVDTRSVRGQSRHYVQKVRGSFTPLKCNQRNVDTLLNSLSFKLRSQDVKYQARVRMTKESSGLFIFDENLKVTELRLSDLKWMMVDICRGLKQNGGKRMDVRCKLQSGRHIEGQYLKSNLSVLTKSEQNRVRIARPFIGMITFAREKHIKYYQCEGHISTERNFPNMDIEVSTVTEYSNPTSDGTFSTVVSKQELTVVPKLPSLDEENDEWIKYIKQISELIEFFGEHLDSD
ncbi:uncharacterized protein LOC110455104 [Mizuhopecten yessoensis]|uniref:RNA-directed RNA polymerase n=1 Tax=Mizuhopecten yessoensis TaxID=6573 RepID=A0A210QDW8_MIZYE|nr:uncharacterized protein LOC110455104 [Mizuhopecten yessoensis]OWF46871.1 RNA-dependent RNA polymerase 1 [Mizuhopecten yessoensis]